MFQVGFVDEMSTRREPLAVGSRFGPYRVDRLIGRGGMGEVYQAYDTAKDRTVALKVLPERLAEDPVYRQRFQRESRAAARLREAHVIPIHDYGEIEGRLFIDMRLVDGDSLRSLLHETGPGTPERGVGVITQVAGALDAAHADGLLHRDVKPDNILIARDGFAYLVDFGIAQSSSDESLTSTGAAIGSYRYMAPERFSSATLTRAVDVYGLACVLFEFLTGARPFAGSTDAEVMRAHLFEPIPRPSMVRANVPELFDAVIAKGLAKNPHERYSSAGELAEAAAAALTGAENRSANALDSPVPEPDSNGEPQAVESRRRGVLRILAPALIAALMAVFGTVAWTSARPGVTGTAVPNGTVLNAADIELLSLIDLNGYKRSTCVHEVPEASGLVAMLSCAANYAADNPEVRMWRFADIESLRRYYGDLLAGLPTTNCAGDPVGRDGPSMLNGEEIGRKTCWTSLVPGPSPMPVLLMTNEKELATVMYRWDSLSDVPLRDAVAERNGLQLRPSDLASDPDFFTPADKELLDNLGRDFTRSNCRHLDVPKSSPAAAILACDTPRGFPMSVFLSFSDRELATLVYQNELAKSPGHSCGEGTEGLDSVWIKRGDPVGRYYCQSRSALNVPCLRSFPVHFPMFGIFCALPADDPSAGPKTEAELLSWFENYFE